MKIQNMDQFKKMALDLASEINIDQVEIFVRKSGENTANFVLDKLDFISKNINDPRYKDIFKKFSVLFAFMCMDGCYTDQINYFLNMINKCLSANLPSCKNPVYWRVNNLNFEEE